MNEQLALASFGRGRGRPTLVLVLSVPRTSNVRLHRVVVGDPPSPPRPLPGSAASRPARHLKHSDMEVTACRG